MDSASSVGWHDVSEGLPTAWRAIFAASTEGEDLSAECPVCGHATLHRWFHLHRRSVIADGNWLGRGSQWQWCSSCHSYEHSSGLVPTWWLAPRLLEGV